MSLNICAFTGRFVRDPEIKQTQSGVSVCTFTLAVDRNYTPKGEEKKADFLNFVAWRGAAEFIAKWFKKGDMIAVDSSAQTRTWEDDQGNKRYVTEFIVANANFCGGKSDGSGSAPASDVPEGFTEVADDDDLPF